MNSRIRPTWASSIDPSDRSVDELSGRSLAGAGSIHPPNRVIRASEGSRSARSARLLRALERLAHEHLLCRDRPLAAGAARRGSRSRRARAPTRTACRRGGPRESRRCAPGAIGSSTGASTSIRRSRFRGIRSALPIHVETRSPAWKERIRLCSRNGPSTLRTVMPSLRPGHPGTQLADAARDRLDDDPCPRGRVERLDDLGIDERVHLDPDACGLPLASAARATCPISCRRPSRMNHGATSSLRKTVGDVWLVTALKTSATSAAMSSSAVKRLRSS